MQNEIIELAQKLIALKTVAGNNKEIAACFDFIKNYFESEEKQNKIIVKEYEKNGVLSLVLANSDTLNLDIILNGHIDVISAGSKDFTPYIKNGKLYARGAADMKTQVATMMFVLKEFVKNDTKKSIALILTSDEEIGGKNGISYLTNNIGYTGKVAIIPDAGENFELNIKEKGVLWIKVVATGKSSHGSQPWLGENAIVKLIEFYRNTQKKFPPLRKIRSQYQDGISMNIGKILGGKSVNAVPDYAEIHIDFRYSKKSDKNLIITALKTLTKKSKLMFEIIEDMDASETDSKNFYLKKFKDIGEKIIGRKMKFTKSTGCSCSRFFSTKNIPVILTSPNYGNIHASNEWINTKDINKFYNILSTFLQEF